MTVDAAAMGTASLLATCGACHVSNDIQPTLIAPASSAKGGVTGRMLGHQQAVELMLEGLIAPSPTSWRDGAVGLRTSPLHSGVLPTDPKRMPTTVAAEARLHRLAGEAVSAKDDAARVNIYGRVLGTCASCHRLQPEVPRSRPR